MVLVNDRFEALEAALAGQHLPTYIYSYPPKRAYRPFEPHETLADIWSKEPDPDLNVYVHIPFCRYRCTFCTLFLTTRHDGDERERYVAALERQVVAARQALGDRTIRSIYFGGGTPTSLSADQLGRIMGAIVKAWPSGRTAAEISLETTPENIADFDVAGLRRAGFNRVSIGVQTFVEAELRACGRKYPVETVASAVGRIQDAGIAHISLDLIYGLPGGSRENWATSLAAAVALQPSTLSVYPVVVRPLSTLDKLEGQKRAERTPEVELYSLYDMAHDCLTQAGYIQESFTRFTRKPRGDGYVQEISDFSGTPLLGLGAGARSYTTSVHYSTDYAVERETTKAIIQRYMNDAEEDRLSTVTYGFRLDKDDARRRYVLLNLTLGRVRAVDYRQRFGRDLCHDFHDELAGLRRLGCIEPDSADLIFTALGFKLSSAIGALFFNARVRVSELDYEPQ